MPEGPEAKRMSDQLAKRLVGKTLVNVHGVGGRYLEKPIEGRDDFLRVPPGGCLEQTIEKISCKGKFLWWKFSDDWYMWNTLGMSGRWSFDDFNDHVAVRVSYKWVDGDCVNTGAARFVDARRFGTVKFVKGKASLDKKLRSLGFDLLTDRTSTTCIYHFVKDAKKASFDKPIGTVLMDQSIFAGVGNYLRAEILYASKISPWRKFSELSYEELDSIHENARDIMKRSYESGGATIATYRDAEGNVGSFSRRFACYGQKTDPNSNPIKKEKTPEGRTIHWCPAIQR